MSAVSIKDYKRGFESMYKAMLEDFDVEKASVAITWTAEYKNGVRSIKPIATITF